ncbi:MAG TPA: vWA domain-containing protein [Acidimicrobiales bacterium]|nr:vWA domain-containing protein [Acidimicrobiales bacterium]
MLFRPGGNGSVITGHDGTGEPGLQPGRVTAGATAEIGEIRDLAEVLRTTDVDPVLRRTVRQIAENLAFRRRGHQRTSPGNGPPVSVPWRDNGDDLDIERTVENLVGRRVVAEEDIVVRVPHARRRSVVLVVDASGSMKGDKALLAAAAVGALSGELRDDELTVVAFWKDAAILTAGSERTSPARVLEDLAALPVEGLTNIHVGLHVGAVELARSSARERIAILLSDGVHNAGPDPRTAVGALPRLHVLLETDGEHDAELATDLARLGGGHLAPVRSAGDVAAALNGLFGT